MANAHTHICFQRRLRGLKLLFWCALSVVGARAIQLAGISRAENLEAGKRFAGMEFSIPAHRGAIYDRTA